jgi:hypothetical protein
MFGAVFSTRTGVFSPAGFFVQYNSGKAQKRFHVIALCKNGHPLTGFAVAEAAVLCLFTINHYLYQKKIDKANIQVQACSENRCG